MMKREGQIPTNLRLLLVIEEIIRAGAPLTPTEANNALGLPKPTIHRLFATLEEEGFIQREMDGRSYSPGLRLRRLAAGTLSSLRIRTARLAVLNRLAEEIGETCNISIPDREAMIYLDRVETTWPLRIQLPIGTHVPFYCTASGKMYLSTLNDAHLERWIASSRLIPRTNTTISDRERLIKELHDTRARGHAEDNEEYMDDMIAIAVPVHDQQRRLVSTLSFHAPTMRLSLEDARRHIPRLHNSAAELSTLLLS